MLLGNQPHFENLPSSISTSVDLFVIRRKIGKWYKCNNHSLLDHLCAKCLWVKCETYNCICYHSPRLNTYRNLKSSLIEDKHLQILPSQYHGCRWPGDTCCQGISSHDTDPVFLEYSQPQQQKRFYMAEMVAVISENMDQSSLQRTT